MSLTTSLSQSPHYQLTYLRITSTRPLANEITIFYSIQSRETSSVDLLTKPADNWRLGTTSTVIIALERCKLVSLADLAQAMYTYLQHATFLRYNSQCQIVNGRPRLCVTNARSYWREEEKKRTERANFCIFCVLLLLFFGLCDIISKR